MSFAEWHSGALGHLDCQEDTCRDSFGAGIAQVLSALLHRAHELRAAGEYGPASVLEDVAASVRRLGA